MKVIGIDIGGTNISAGVVEDGKIIKNVSEDIDKDNAVEQITNIIKQLIDSSIKGIGIGAPGIVDSNGIIYEVVNIPSLKKINLKKTFEDKFKIPVEANNDANCFALGEKLYGKGKSYQNLVCLAVGTGLGAGIIINGKIYSGKNSGADEFGRILYLDGELEDYCSGKFFVKNKTTGKKAFEEKNKELFEEFGKHFANAVAITVHALYPELIVLGGSVSKAYDLFKDSMMNKLKSLIYRKSFENLKIDISDNKDIPVLGVAALLTQKVL